MNIVFAGSSQLQSAVMLCSNGFNVDNLKLCIPLSTVVVSNNAIESLDLNHAREQLSHRVLLLILTVHVAPHSMSCLLFSASAIRQFVIIDNHVSVTQVLYSKAARFNSMTTNCITTTHPKLVPPVTG